MNTDIMNIKPLPNTDFETVSTIWYWYIETDFGDINGIFKGMKPTTDIPFITMNGIHKAHRTIDVIPSTWNSEIRDEIALIYPKNQGNTDDFIMIEVQFDEEEKKFTIVMELSKDFIKEKPIEVIYDSVKSMFKRDVVSFTKPIQTDISGTFNINGIKLKNYILLDMITNDKAISKYFTIDEYDFITKRHLTVGFHKDTVIDEIPSTFTFTITQPVSSSVRIKIRKPQGMNDIKIFINVLTRALAYYETKRDEISKIYKIFGIEEVIPVNTIITPKKSKKVKGGSRSCPKHREISMFDTSEEASNKMAKQTSKGTPIGPEHILEFPKNAQGSKYYVCTDPKSPYPGMVRQTKQNDKYILCCFGAPQVGTRTSEWHRYTNPDTYVETKYQNEYELGGNKILDDNRTGETPDILNFLNKFIEVDSKNAITKDFKRLGVANTPKSIVTCLYKALGLDVKTDYFNDVPSSMFATAKQELYDHSVFEIEKLAKDPLAIMKYSEFASFLEELYNIKLIVFSADGILTPRYKHGFYRRSNTNNIVVLFEQPNYQYELIFQEQIRPNNSFYTFAHDSLIAQTLIPFLDERLVFKINDLTVEDVNLKIPDGWRIVSQQFDSYGKTRRINMISQTGQSFDMYTSPLQPYNVPEDTNPIMTPYSQAKYNSLIDEIINIMLPTYNIIEDVNEIMIVNGVFNIKIPLITGDKPPIIASEINTYMRGRRIARYLLENAFWISSQFPDAMNEKIVVKKGHTYNKTITKQFDLNSGIYEDGKIVVTSENIKKRLLFNVNMMVIRDPKKLETYKTKKFVPNFYNDTTDFIDLYDKSVSESRNMRDMSFNVFMGDNIFTYKELDMNDDDDDEQ